MNPLSLLLDKEKNLVLYEDEVLFAHLPQDGEVEGHVRVYPKKDVKFVDELSEDEIDHLFHVSSKIATAIFEGVGAQGTNIILNNGFKEIFEINIIPRFEGDGLNYQWEMKQADPNELESIKKKLKQHTEFIGSKIDENQIKNELKDNNNNNNNNIDNHKIEQDLDNESNDEEDYRIRQINRIP